MDTPQSKAFWLGRNLNIVWFQLAAGGNPEDKNLSKLTHIIEGFAKSLDLRVEIPPPAEMLTSLGKLREGIRLDLAITRTEFVAKCYLFGFDYSMWVNSRDVYSDEQGGSTVDLSKVESNLRSEARDVGLSTEMEESLSAAKNRAMPTATFNEFIALDMVLRMTAKLDTVSSTKVASKPASNRLFIVMPMDQSDPALPDVLESIQSTATSLGLEAFRVDELASAGRITDNILDSLKSAAFVVTDLTHSRPNVYWEAGYTHGLGKIPIYIARTGTDPAFDIKDYPVIYFANNIELKQKLAKRLRGMLAEAASA